MSWGKVAAAAAGVGAALLWGWDRSKVVQLPRPHTPAASGQCGAAVVVGASGATGRQVVRALLASDKWSSVKAVSRRLQDPAKVFGVEDTPKLRQAVVSFDESGNASALEDACRGTTALFICLGTSKAAAGSPEAFHAVEVGHVTAIAAAAKRAGVEHALVVSAQGANANTWVPHDSLHMFFYMKTLGEKEQAVLGQGFPRTSVFRPGILDRMMGDRGAEGLVIKKLGIGLPVDVLARCMVRAAESIAESRPEAPAFYENNRLIAQCGSSVM